MVLRIPSWVLPGALYDFDFANYRFFGGYVGLQSIASMNSYLCEINSGAPDNTLTAFDSAGTVRLFPSLALRRTDLGIWVEGNHTNYCLESRTLNTATWTKTNTTATRDQVGMTGSGNSACLITATAANGAVSQARTLSEREYLLSMFMKRSAGTGPVEISLDNGSTYTDVTADINSGTFARVAAAAQTLANPTVVIRLGTSGDAVIVDMVQLESPQLGIVLPSTPIITTTASRARGPEAAMFNTTGGTNNNGQRLIADTFFGTPMSVYAEFSGNAENDCVVKGGGSTNTTIMNGGADGGPVTFGNGLIGTKATTANSGNFGFGNINKAIGRIGGGGCGVCLNGGAIATNTSAMDPSGTDDHCAVGNRGAGDKALNGTVRRLTFWRKELSDGQMIEWTQL